MKPVDVFLQRYRAQLAARRVPDDAKVLDIGCFDGLFLEQIENKISCGVGIDPDCTPSEREKISIRRGFFPQDAPLDDGENDFDCITKLAVFEHFEKDAQEVANACAAHLKPGGKVVLTVPHALVDEILEVLMKVKLIDGMETEQHHGLEVRDVPDYFLRAGFRLELRRAFQFGLNHLFVFVK
ncbi:MAG: class I SAM-dependent methyltransferase [Deltaproteobacteria bacterium]|nr:class I SAM-dependent methyltransferase [Deltaproteobacteria bacterium]